MNGHIHIFLLTIFFFFNFFYSAICLNKFFAQNGKQTLTYTNAHVCFNIIDSVVCQYSHNRKKDSIYFSLIWNWYSKSYIYEHDCLFCLCICIVPCRLHLCPLFKKRIRTKSLSYFDWMKKNWFLKICE